MLLNGFASTFAPNVDLLHWTQLESWNSQNNCYFLKTSFVRTSEILASTPQRIACVCVCVCACVETKTRCTQEVKKLNDVVDAMGGCSNIPLKMRLHLRNRPSPETHTTLVRWCARARGISSTRLVGLCANACKPRRCRRRSRWMTTSWFLFGQLLGKERQTVGFFLLMLLLLLLLFRENNPWFFF